MVKNLFQKLFRSSKKECCSDKEHCCQFEKTLSNIKSGKSVRIESLRGEDAVCQRLREMGFCEASVVEKIADSGALICKVCDAKVAISKKLAQNIIVEDICHLPGHPHSTGNKILLSQMAVGQKAVIRDFVVESDDCERISEMGVTPGEIVEVIRYAPMGDPIEIKIRGYLLSLRKEEADLIKVSVIS